MPESPFACCQEGTDALTVLVNKLKAVELNPLDRAGSPQPKLLVAIDKHTRECLSFSPESDVDVPPLALSNYRGRPRALEAETEGGMSTAATMGFLVAAA